MAYSVPCNTRLTAEQIQNIESALGAKKRVEIVKTDNGLKIYTVHRKELHS